MKLFIDINTIYKNNNTSDKNNNSSDKNNSLHVSKALDIYNQLKASISNIIQHENVNTNFETIESTIYFLKVQLIFENNGEIHTRLVQYMIGTALTALKKLSKSKEDFYDHLKKNTKYELSWAYWLISFAWYCEHYPKLQQTTLSSYLINKYWKQIKEFIKADYLFWGANAVIDEPSDKRQKTDNQCTVKFELEDKDTINKYNEETKKQKQPNNNAKKQKQPDKTKKQKQLDKTKKQKQSRKTMAQKLPKKNITKKKKETADKIEKKCDKLKLNS